MINERKIKSKDKKRDPLNKSTGNLDYVAVIYWKKIKYLIVPQKSKSLSQNDLFL